MTLGFLLLSSGSGSGGRVAAYYYKPIAVKKGEGLTMIECSVNAISKDYGDRVFEKITFSLKKGDRAALVGQNGCGKSTLIKILMGIEEYGEGSVNIRKDARLGYLEQMPDVGEKKTDEVLMGAFSRALDLKDKISELEQQLTYLTGEAMAAAIERYGKYIEAYEGLDGYQLETKINRICQGLGITNSMREMAFEILSGGEKTRVILGKLLLEEPDILLLDEPSNHLDIASIEWLEGFLREYKGTLLIVSHDRYFLDRVVNRVLELTPSEIKDFIGNYSDYVVEKERRFIEELKQYQNQQRQLDRIKEQIHRYRVWGAMRDSEVMYKRAKELEKRLEKIEVLDKPMLENKNIQLTSAIDKRSGKQVLVVEGINKAFDDKNLIVEGSFTVYYQDSICLMGPNGSGKSTLLKMVVGELVPDGGVIRLGAEVKIGYLPQQIVFPDEEKSLVDYFSYEHGISQNMARGALAKLLFQRDTVNKQIKSLSGGERTKLKLCSLLYERVNFLILDEPTNHLDIASREELEEVLMSFEGTLFFVSHDRYFIEKVADKIVCIEEGGLVIYPFGYNSYIQQKSKNENKNPQPQDKASALKVSRRKEPSANNSRKISTVTVEREIAAQEESLKAILREMELNQCDHMALIALTQEQDRIKGELEGLYSQWEALMGLEEKAEY